LGIDNLLTWKGSAIMRKYFWLFLFVFLVILSAKGLPAQADSLQMVSAVSSTGQDLSNLPGNPLPVVSPGDTTISITFNQPIWITAYPGPYPPQTYMNAFTVSGKYDLGFFISSASNTWLSPTDNKTLILNDVNLPEDDTITVQLNEGIAAGSGASGTFSFSFTTPAVTAVTPFDDPVLEQAVKHALEAACSAKYNLWNFQFPSDREIYQHDNPYAIVEALYMPTDQPIYVPIPAMDDLTSLQYPYEADQYFGAKIQSISGLVYAKNLTQLTLNNNDISNLTPLQGLTKLQTLNLDMNDLTDNGLVTANLAPLSNLTQLTQLDLNSCNISDITALQSIGNNLTYLDLGNNKISGIGALSSLTGLQTLYLSSNQITDITPLSGLASLTQLKLGSNQISAGAPLGNLTALTDLELGNNELIDIGFLSKLTNLQTLDLSHNNIIDISPLQNLTNLGTLDQSDGTYGTLDLSDNSIVDISPLQNLINLQSIDLSDNCLNDGCFTVLEANSGRLSNIADISGAQLFTVAAYEDYVTFMQGQNALVSTLKPFSSSPSDEESIADGAVPLTLDYKNMPFSMQQLINSNYLSQIEVYINGVLTPESLTFDPSSTPDSLVLDHTPFPNASTITVVVPPLLVLGSSNTAY
jgi:hypothetical protein